MASIEVAEFLPQPPGRVWQALTDSALLARWLMPNDFRPAVGHQFTFRTEPVPQHGFDGIVQCEVLALEPLYPSYPATIQASGARLVRVPAPPDRGPRPARPAQICARPDS